MRPEDRRQAIIDTLIEHGAVALDVFADQFAVSKMTIHRDIDQLESVGLLRKVLGGASIKASGQFEIDFRYRARTAVSEKRAIAKRATDFIEPLTNVMIDDGTTSAEIGPFLIDRRPLTVIINNMALISALSTVADPDLIVLDGSFSRKFYGFLGLLTEKAVIGLRADVALLSNSSIADRTAFHQDQQVLEVKRRMMASSASRYLMVDHQKFGRTALYALSDLSAFDGVITSKSLPQKTSATLIEAGTKLYFPEDK